MNEFASQASTRFGSFTKTTGFQNEEMLTKTKLYHPYVFCGIHGLPPGKAYEQLRSNQGIYLEKPTLPFAELKIRLRFNNLIGMYSFDIPEK